MNKYADIINLSRPKSKYPKMPLNARAAQFAPFAALTGYGEAIDETSRITDKKRILSEEETDEINQKISYIDNNIKKELNVIIIYYLQDKKKDGGKYLTVKNNELVS